jgi:cation diffusion facilitator family transporter
MHIEADREKNSAALTSVIAAFFLTGMKIVVGVMTGSLGILSEAAHSALDLVAALVTLVAVRLSGRPADVGHNYGHGKVENLSALLETLLLLVTCVWIIYEAFHRLLFKDVHVEVNIWSFLVMGASIIIDISRSRVLMRVAKKYNSQALEADGLHFSTDVWSSSVVIGGLILVKIAEVTHLSWLVKADAVAALVVAMIVIYVSLQLGKRTLEGLLDAAPRGTDETIRQAVAHVDGVVHVDAVRVRQSGAETFSDVTISVARALPLDEAHRVAVSVEDAVRAVIPNSDVMVHTEPHDDSESVLQDVRLVAQKLRLDVHNVAVQRIGGHLYLALDLEVSPALSLGEAHELATRLERRLRADIAGIVRIDTHIEPRPQAETRGRDVTAQSPQVVAAVREAMRDLPLISGHHSITVLESANGYSVSVHCTFDPTISIADVHQISDVVSQRVRERVTEVRRVIVHAEP